MNSLPNKAMIAKDSSVVTGSVSTVHRARFFHARLPANVQHRMPL